MGLLQDMDEFMTHRIAQALASHPDSYEDAARSLGLSRRILQYQMRRLGITRQEIVQSSVEGVPAIQYPQGAVRIPETHRLISIPVNGSARSGFSRKIAVRVNVSVED